MVGHEASHFGVPFRRGLRVGWQKRLFSQFCWHARVRPDTPREAVMSNKINEVVEAIQIGDEDEDVWTEPTARSVLITLYGDVSAEAAEWEMDAASATHPREAGLASHRMIAVCARWGAPRPYLEILADLRLAQDIFRKKGWRIALRVDGVLDTGTAVLDLSMEDRFPEGPPDLGGYNAALGFRFEAEKPWLSTRWGRTALKNIELLTRVLYKFFDMGIEPKAVSPRRWVNVGNE